MGFTFPGGASPSGGSGVTDRGSWAATTAYAKGDRYTDPNGLRRDVTTAYTSGGAFGSTDTTNTSVTGAATVSSGGVTLPWVTATAYKTGQAVTNSGLAYVAVDDHTSGATFVGDYAHWVLRPKGRTTIPFLEQVRLWAFGHSYQNGATAGPLSQRLASRNFMNFSGASNKAAAGTTPGQAVSQIRSAGGFNGLSGPSTLDGLVTMCSLINNCSDATTIAEQYRAFFANAVYGPIAITTSSFAFTGTWSSGVSSTVGSYFDFAFNGDSAYIATSFFTGGGGGTVTVKYSGTSDAVAQTVTTGAWAEAFPGVIKLAGFGPGRHTVRVTLTAGTVTILGGLLLASTPPTVLWCKEGAIPAKDSAANTLMTTTVPNAVAPILADFPTVIAVGVDGAWDQNTMIYDGTHLNDKGLVYWADLMERALAQVGFRGGQNYTSSTAAGIVNYNTLPAPGYRSGSYSPRSFTNLKTWSGDPKYVYALSPDTDLGTSPAVGDNIIVTGGTGWTPGAYVIGQVLNAYGTPDGTHTMVQVDRAPAAAGTAGGAGNLTI